MAFAHKLATSVCPACDGSGHSDIGPTPAGGYCGTCRGEGSVTPETRGRWMKRFASSPEVVTATLIDCITSYEIPSYLAERIAEYILSDASGLTVTAAL